MAPRVKHEDDKDIIINSVQYDYEKNSSTF